MKNSLIIADTLLSPDARNQGGVVKNPGKNGEAGENDLPQMLRAMGAAPRHRLPLT